jgi:hypothetical protein
MTDTKRPTTVLGLGLAAALLALTACGGGDSESAGGSSSEETSESPSAQGQLPEPDLEGIPDVVAEVNGQEVTRDEFVTSYTAQFQQAAMQAQMGGGEQPDEEALKEQTANTLVDTELLMQEAEERGIDASEQDVEDKLTELAKQNQLGSSEEFLAALEEQGTSADQVRTQVETQVVVERLVADESGSVEPTEKELRTLYEQAKQQQEQAGQQSGQQQKIPPFEKVRAQLEEQAVAQEQGQAAQALVDELRDGADITINL